MKIVRLVTGKLSAIVSKDHPLLQIPDIVIKQILCTAITLNTKWFKIKRVCSVFFGTTCLQKHVF
ncbi:Protein of unknown function [Gryllus bimaculatus]|nr:Protein of unknown function [Gryllus bimaculatus]